MRRFRITTHRGHTVQMFQILESAASKLPKSLGPDHYVIDRHGFQIWNRKENWCVMRNSHTQPGSGSRICIYDTNHPVTSMCDVAVRGGKRRQHVMRTARSPPRPPELPSSWRSEQLRKSPHEPERAAGKLRYVVVERWNARSARRLWSPTIRCGVVARRPQRGPFCR